MQPQCYIAGMRAVIQRVSHASVTVGGEVVGAIKHGFLVFIGVTHGDSLDDARVIGEKIAGLRVFTDAEDKMNLSVRDVGGSVLLVSQFTLYGNVAKGRRPHSPQRRDLNTPNRSSTPWRGESRHTKSVLRQESSVLTWMSRCSTMGRHDSAGIG